MSAPSTRTRWGRRPPTLRLVSVVAFAVLAVWASGCGLVLGIEDVPTPNADAAGAGQRAAPFLGSWTSAAATQTVDCEGTVETTHPSASVSIRAGTDSDLVFADDECAMRANVSGDTATLFTGEPCRHENGAASFTYSYGDGTTFTLGSDRNTAAFDANGELVSEADGTRCTFKLTTAYVKSGP